MTQKILEIYNVINCLNKNLITHFVCYVEKEIRCYVETLPIDRELNKELFLWKNHAENGREKSQKFEYLENEKGLLDEIKNIFHSF